MLRIRRTKGEYGKPWTGGSYFKVIKGEMRREDHLAIYGYWRVREYEISILILLFMTVQSI